MKLFPQMDPTADQRHEQQQVHLILNTDYQNVKVIWVSRVVRFIISWIQQCHYAKISP